MQSVTLGEIHQFLGGTLEGNPETKISGLKSLGRASSKDMAGVFREEFLSEFETSKAGAYLVEESFPIQNPDGKNILRIRDARINFSKVADLIFPVKKESGEISPDARIAPGAKIGKEVTIYPFAFIGENVILENSCVIYPGVFIGDGTKIGENTVIHSGCMIYHQTEIGKNCVIGANSVIGSDGFGYEKDRSGNYRKIRHVGSVIIEDEVELGSCCTIDRGTYDDTLIGKGSKFDNLIHIAHNVQIGENNLLAAQVGFAGSASSGKDCIFLGQSGVNQNVQVQTNTILRSKSAFHKKNPEGGLWIGDPALPSGEQMRITATLPHLPEIKKRVKHLEKKFENFEKK